MISRLPSIMGKILLFLFFVNGLTYSQVNESPYASFTYTSNGLILQFSDNSFDNDGTVVSWSWDFGDSSYSNEKNPSHTYSEANTYLINLTVFDNAGDSNTIGQFIVVQPLPGGRYGDFTEITPLDSVFVTPEAKDLWVVATTPADYDQDGDLDIAVLGYYVLYNEDVVDKLILLKNNGPDSSDKWNYEYHEVPLPEYISIGSSDIIWGDVDGDADMDLVVGSDGYTIIYKNDNASLVLTNTQLPGYFEDNSQSEFDLKSISLADYDNDGDNDLLIPSVFNPDEFNFRTVLMRNDGTDNSGNFIFTEVDSVFASTYHAQSTWADYDNDQDLDLLLIDVSPYVEESFIRRYRNDGNGKFTGEDILGTLAIGHGEGQWGDYDNDGDLDILIAGNIKDTNDQFLTTVRIYRNDSTSYYPVEVVNCIPCDGWIDFTAATWADYNSDGAMDILLAGSYNSGNQIEGLAKVYLNNNGTFVDSLNTLPAPLSSGMRGGTFSWFDLDGDADLDYFIAGQYYVPGGNGLVDAQMHVYRNDSENKNNAPAKPSGLNAGNNNNDTVLLTWNSSTDDHTPAEALTYDLELYKENVPVKVPQRLPQPGNISSVNEWLLTGLSSGSYTWVIRAVDASYSGSDIATGSFSVGTTSVANEGSLPIEFGISQNYPNPFNPSTKIKFQIPIASQVRIDLYDVLGNLVNTITNKQMNAGYYEEEFNLSNYTSGVYFYKIQAGSFTEVKKMMLLK